MSEGKVYIARDKDRLKIGFSKDPASRIRTLKTACLDIELFFEIGCDRRLETVLHQKFKVYSLGREWFLGSPDLLDEIVAFAKTEAERLNKTPIDEDGWTTVRFTVSQIDRLHKIDPVLNRAVGKLLEMYDREQKKKEDEKK